MNELKIDGRTVCKAVCGFCVSTAVSLGLGAMVAMSDSNKVVKFAGGIGAALVGMYVKDASADSVGEFVDGVFDFKERILPGIAKMNES